MSSSNSKLGSDDGSHGGRADVLAGLLASVTDTRRNKLDHAQDFVARLASDWQHIRRQELERNARENHHFSPLRLISIKETDHSKLLGDLLKPHGTHGQGRHFLDSFLTILEVDVPSKGDWEVTVEAGRVDILLVRDNPQSVVIIENKANDAGDQDGQLYRYWYQEIYRRDVDLNYDDPATRRRFKVVYAPAQGFSSPSENSICRPVNFVGGAEQFVRLPLPVDCRSFKLDFAPWLEKMALEAKSERMRVFLKLYAEIWRVGDE